MSVELNHIIVYARDKRASARFLADVPGLTPGPDWGGFVPLQTGNGVTLDLRTHRPPLRAGAGALARPPVIKL